GPLVRLCPALSSHRRSLFHLARLLSLSRWKGRAEPLAFTASSRPRRALPGVLVLAAALLGRLRLEAPVARRVGHWRRDRPRRRHLRRRLVRLLGPPNRA